MNTHDRGQTSALDQEDTSVSKCSIATVHNMAFAWRAAGLSYAPPLPRPLPYPDIPQHRYNRFLQIASRVVRRSLKDEQRLIAEKRGEMDLRFAKWEVSRDHRALYATASTQGHRS